MGVVINPESALGQELAKWDRPRPWQEFPKMLYRAQRTRQGQTAVVAPAVSPFGWRDDNEYQMAITEAEQFTKSCQRTVASESEELVAKGQGWANSPGDAMALAEKEAQDIGDAAAEILHDVQGRSEKIQAEVAEVDALTYEHVPEIGGQTRQHLTAKAEAEAALVTDDQAHRAKSSTRRSGAKTTRARKPRGKA